MDNNFGSCSVDVYFNKNIIIKITLMRKDDVIYLACISGFAIMIQVKICLVFCKSSAQFMNGLPWQLWAASPLVCV